ncbi:MAG: carboxypeptidase-like regulatory domain-containing protein, partial [Tannerella sp.]|nr:carboxypeptidase-like regulatory domain-containing protein [Tannerella sp.]
MKKLLILFAVIIAGGTTAKATLPYSQTVLFDLKMQNVTLEAVFKEIENRWFVANVQQTRRTVTGKVIDADGEPIISANVVEKGASNGTVTDANGHFSLTVRNNAVIEVSYIGYILREIKTEGIESPLTITLVEDTKMLEEVVVVGYGTQKKVNLTGSVASVKGDVLDERPVASVAAGLQGI